MDLQRLGAACEFVCNSESLRMLEELGATCESAVIAAVLVKAHPPNERLVTHKLLPRFGRDASGTLLGK